ncbi:ribonuclease HIII, partial [Mycoplasmopsis synoviae]
YASALISQKSYNILFTKFNANEIKFLAHAEAINNLKKKVKKSELLIIDAYVNSDPSFNKYYKKIIVSYKDLYDFSPWKEKIAILKKAESHYIEVAAAYIV